MVDGIVLWNRRSTKRWKPEILEVKTVIPEVGNWLEGLSRFECAEEKQKQKDIDRDHAIWKKGRKK